RERAVTRERFTENVARHSKINNIFGKISNKNRASQENLDYARLIKLRKS
ncbi:hypothetical protein HMPREF1583_01082, partial [Gardnerella vaginalis JCP8151B]